MRYGHVFRCGASQPVKYRCQAAHQRPDGSSVSEMEIRAPAVRLCRFSSLMCAGEILCASDQRLMPGP